MQGLKGLDRTAFMTLGLLEDPDSYDVQAVDSRWREIRSQLHPDRPGGDAAKFDQARKAYQAARFYTLVVKPCVACNGHGRVQTPSQRGSFSAPLTAMCSACRGSGKR